VRIRIHAAFVCGLLLLGSAAAAADASPFRLERLGEGIHFVRPADPSDPLRTNALLVQRDDGPLVVESQPTEAAAREMLAAIRAVEPRPVRYLVLSHAHAESSGGAGAFPAETLVIASRRARVALEDPGFDTGAEARARSAAWRPPERPRLPTLVLDDLQRMAVVEALRRHDGARGPAAAELGVAVKTLYNKINQASELERSA